MDDKLNYIKTKQNEQCKKIDEIIETKGVTLNPVLISKMRDMQARMYQAVDTYEKYVEKVHNAKSEKIEISDRIHKKD